MSNIDDKKALIDILSVSFEKQYEKRMIITSAHTAEDLIKKNVVIQKYAQWIASTDGYYFHCSNCKEEAKSGKLTKFCHECGSKMRLFKC